MQTYAVKSLVLKRMKDDGFVMVFIESETLKSGFLTAIQGAQSLYLTEI